MNLKRITIAMTVVLIGIGNINAQDMKTEVPKISDFPVGEENTGYAQYFTGKSWLASLTTSKELNVPMSNVTFEPGCRNNWHNHTGGQLLIAVGGVGYYQERGKVARRLLPGDVVEIAPNVEHWHGAAPDSWFSHLAIACNPQTNQNTWLEVVNDEEYAEAVKDRSSENGKDENRIDLCKKNFTQLFGGEALTGEGTDPEIMDILQKYIFGEVFRTGDLDMKTREMITCVSLAAMQQLPQLKSHAGAALNVGVTPIELREAIYQCAPIIGFPKVLNALGTINSTFTERGIKLPLEKQETVTEENRLEKGLAIQKPLYGEAMKELLKDVPGGMGADVARFLTEVHFGDFQTRSGLNIQTRELLTFCVLTVIGAEPQLQSHLQANLKVDNSKETLTAAVIQCMPYIGFPAAIKVLDIIKEA
jgi:4-carboxymuconolactone decarboxylase|nr:carboxymuconolactone decarboxylase family protein [Bacteroides intestinalis]